MQEKYDARAVETAAQQHWSAIDAYRAVEKIHWDGMHYRTDIGRKAVRRLGGSLPQAPPRAGAA